MAESEPRELVEKDKLYRGGLLSLHSQAFPNQVITDKCANWISWKDFLRSILPESNFRVQVLLALTRFKGFATSVCGKHISLQGTVKCSSRGVSCALIFPASLQGNVYMAAFPCWRWHLPDTVSSEGERHKSEWSYDPVILPLGAFSRGREQGLEWMFVTWLFTAPALTVITGWNNPRIHRWMNSQRKRSRSGQWHVTQSQRGSSAWHRLPHKWTLRTSCKVKQANHEEN